MTSVKLRLFVYCASEFPPICIEGPGLLLCHHAPVKHLSDVDKDPLRPLPSYLLCFAGSFLVLPNYTCWLCELLLSALTFPLPSVPTGSFSRSFPSRHSFTFPCLIPRLSYFSAVHFYLCYLLIAS